MASEQTARNINGSGGYLCKFVEESQSDELFKCKICTLILRDPHITDCCGENACHLCIVKAAENGGPCPIPGCRSKRVKINLNRDLRSIILESDVYCQSKEAGCEWVGKLDELNKHLKECLFVEEECQRHCGIQIQRQAVEHHESVCERLPIKCYQCEEMYERHHHANHVKICPFTKVECPFHIVGCKSKVANKDLQQHFNESLTEHYTMVVNQSQSVQAQLRDVKQTTRDQKEKLELDNTEIDRLNMEITNAKEIVTKLQHSLEEAKRTHTELQGIHDQLKAQIETHTQHRVAMSCGLQKDLATLTFESKVRCYGPALLPIDSSDIVSRPIHHRPTTKELTPRISFSIPNFAKECKNDAVLCLPPFYSHRGGYKMCLVVYCCGYKPVKGNYLTILVRVLKGKYDEYLQWPLYCTVEIEIKKVYGPDINIRRSYDIKAQNRVYQDNCLNSQYVIGHTKPVDLSLVGLNLIDGSLKIDVNSVTN